MKSKVIGILETRTGAHMAELIGRRGGIPLLAPALEEVPDVAPQAVETLIGEWHDDPFSLVIFQTGVGTKALFAAAEAGGVDGHFKTLLASTCVAVRGPKPTGELNGRGVRIDVRAPSPFTTETLMEALAAVPLAGARVLVQRYGAANERLRTALAERGASVLEIATYRWAVPQDAEPLRRLLAAIRTGHVDAVAFTSAVQVDNLLTVAAEGGDLPDVISKINALVVASIGPVCSRALRARGIVPSFEASPPKLGPFMLALEHALTPV